MKIWKSAGYLLVAVAMIGFGAAQGAPDAVRTEGGLKGALPAKAILVDRRPPPGDQPDHVDTARGGGTRLKDDSLEGQPLEAFSRALDMAFEAVGSWPEAPILVKGFDMVLTRGRGPRVPDTFGFAGRSGPLITALVQALADSNAPRTVVIVATIQYKGDTLSCTGSGPSTGGPADGGLLSALREVAEDCVNALDGERGAARKRASIHIARQRAFGILQVDAAECTSLDAGRSAEHYLEIGQSLWKAGSYEAAMPCYLRTESLAKEGAAYREACFQIGMMYELGQGVERDLEKAKIWYERAGLSF